MNEENNIQPEYSLEELGLLKYFEYKTNGYGWKTPILTYEAITKDTGKDEAFIKCYTWCLVRKKEIAITGNLENGATITLTGECKPQSKTMRQKIRRLLDGLTETQKRIAKVMLKQIRLKHQLKEAFDAKASEIQEMVRNEVGIEVPDEEFIVAIETLVNGGVIQWTGAEWVFGDETNRLFSLMTTKQKDAFARALNK